MFKNKFVEKGDSCLTSTPPPTVPRGKQRRYLTPFSRPARVVVSLSGWRFFRRMKQKRKRGGVGVCTACSYRIKAWKTSNGLSFHGTKPGRLCNCFLPPLPPPKISSYIKCRRYIPPATSLLKLGIGASERSFFAEGRRG